ncbi:hypothetical protein D3C79_1059170 [compost metagenome]
MRSSEVAGHDRTERVAQQDGPGAQAERGHEAGDELPVALNGVFIIHERLRASERRQVGHDDAHFRKLVHNAQ